MSVWELSDIWRLGEAGRCQQKLYAASCLGRIVLMGGGAHIESAPRW